MNAFIVLTLFVVLFAVTFPTIQDLLSALREDTVSRPVALGRSEDTGGAA